MSEYLIDIHAGNFSYDFNLTLTSSVNDSSDVNSTLLYFVDYNDSEPTNGRFMTITLTFVHITIMWMVNITIFMHEQFLIVNYQAM